MVNLTKAKTVALEVKIEQLEKRLAAPVTGLLILLNGPKERVGIKFVGDKLMFDDAYFLLDEARRILQEQEIQARLAQAPQPEGGAECVEKLPS